jgi:hypothetical protein
MRLVVLADGHRVALSVCPTCAALVADLELHRRWHAAQR